jgi:SAM-dependent methyltransferase
MTSSGSAQTALMRAAWQWWRDVAARDGRFAATRQLISSLWDFACDSTPARMRQRFGDAEYDWDHRVNTTSGAVGWRDRLLGVFHSPYQPTEPDLFREMLEALREVAGVDFNDFVFVDLGSGKGRTLLMASDYPFRKIIGVELLPALNIIAEGNLRDYKSERQQCFALETVCADATAFSFPGEPLLLYLFNPFPEAGLRRVIERLEQRLRENPRMVYVLYHNPLLEHLLAERAGFGKIGGTHQYSIYAAERAGDSIDGPAAKAATF